MTRKPVAVAPRDTAGLHERGINLDVRGTALIAQAKQRSAWHKQNAATIAAQLRIASDDDDLRDKWRQMEISRQMRGHEEHARFLDFVARNLKPTRLYRVNLQDLSHLEIMPKGSYL